MAKRQRSSRPSPQVRKEGAKQKEKEGTVCVIVVTSPSLTYTKERRRDGERDPPAAQAPLVLLMRSACSSSPLVLFVFVVVVTLLTFAPRALPPSPFQSRGATHADTATHPHIHTHAGISSTTGMRGCHTSFTKTRAPHPLERRLPLSLSLCLSHQSPDIQTEEEAASRPTEPRRAPSDTRVVP